VKEAQYIKGKGIIWCGKHYTLRNLAKDFDIDRYTLSRRLQRGMSVEEALSVPRRKRKAADPRKVAERKGKNKYEGKLCEKHNSRIRYVANYRCVQCHYEDNVSRRKK